LESSLFGVPYALTVLPGLAVIILAMTLLWAASLPLKDASIVDPFWGPGFLLVAAVTALVWSVSSLRGWLVLGCVALWALRLGGHLLRRNRSHGEDPRYARWREDHGAAFWWVSLFKIFWLQALLLWIVAWPLMLAVVSEGGIGGWDVAALMVFTAGFLCEAVADGQLQRFRQDPANEGKVLDTGLWRYSRHPNYFGDALLWWGLYLFAVGAGAWWTLFGPVVMTVLLLKVSGVSLLEEDIEERRPAYADYIRRTSAFIPLPPKDPDA